MAGARCEHAAKGRNAWADYGIIAVFAADATSAAGMAKDSPIQFKGTALKIIQVLVQSTDLTLLHASLADLTGNSPDFFENDLAVLDFSKAVDLPASVEWAGIRNLLRNSGLHAAATLGLPEEQAVAAAAAGLPAISPAALSRPTRAKAPEPEAAPPPAVETKPQ